ncbi:MAG: hypothetical protein ACLFVT_07245 [Syntrophobacteria bacterium]
MAGKKLLQCLKKRDVLNADRADAAELIKLGERYLQEDRLSDAIDFFEKAGYRDGLYGLRERCVGEGDYFLYQRLTKILNDSPDNEEWIRLGDNALVQGKLLFARQSYLRAGHSQKLAQVETLLGFNGEIPEKERLH